MLLRHFINKNDKIKLHPDKKTLNDFSFLFAVVVPSCNLWVSGINSSTRANDLKALFNKHVKVNLHCITKSISVSQVQLFINVVSVSCHKQYINIYLRGVYW